MEPLSDRPTAPPLLIVGCGYVGQRLAQRLAPQRRVVALVRSSDTAGTLVAAGIETLRIDLDEPSAPADATVLEAIRSITHGGSIAWLAPPPDIGDGDPRLRRFLAWLGDVRPQRFVYMSTTAVYGDSAGASVTETAPLSPGTGRGRRRVAAERCATDWCAARGVRSVILRVPGIYGPGRLPLERLRRGEPALRPEDAGPGNRIHVDDLVSVCCAALERDVCGPFNVGDGDHSSTTQWLQCTAELAGLPLPPLVSRAEAPARLAPGMLAFLAESRRVDTTRMREVLGVVLRHPSMRSGIAASLSAGDSKTRQ